jgi:nitrite reductase/ring-hydroxylating ferredoxin subunit
MEGQIIGCPWPKFEFDLATGRSIHDPERMHVSTYEVTVEDGRIVLHL